MQGMDYLRAIVIMLAFYSFSVTAITHYLPSDVTGTGIFTNLNTAGSVQNINAQVNSGLGQQLNIPVFDLGSLIYYSGNFIVDMLVNFVFAIPQIIGIFFAGLFYLFGVDAFIANQILLVIKVLAGTSYTIMLITLLINVRSRTASFM